MTPKEDFIARLSGVGREGMDSVLNYLEKAKFYEAPASARRHLNCEGGLMQHSLNVCDMALRLREPLVAMNPDLAPRLQKESIIVAALLHDICKTSVYKKTQKFRKDKEGRWETYDAYETDYSRFPLGHGEKSVIMLLRLGLQLTNDEILAIRWHMSAWDLPFQSSEMRNSISEASSRYPLVPLLHAADALATHLMENDTAKTQP